MKSILIKYYLLLLLVLPTFAVIQTVHAIDPDPSNHYAADCTDISDSDHIDYYLRFRCRRDAASGQWFAESGSGCVANDTTDLEFIRDFFIDDPAGDPLATLQSDGLLLDVTEDMLSNGSNDSDRFQYNSLACNTTDVDRFGSSGADVCLPCVLNSTDLSPGNQERHEVCDASNTCKAGLDCATIGANQYCVNTNGIIEDGLCLVSGGECKPLTDDSRPMSCEPDGTSSSSGAALGICAFNNTNCVDHSDCPSRIGYTASCNHDTATETNLCEYTTYSLNTSSFAGCDPCWNFMKYDKGKHSETDAWRECRAELSEVELSEEASCEGCMGSAGAETGAIWTELGCIDPSPSGLITRIFQIAVGILGGLGIFRVIQISLAFQSSDDAQIQEAQEMLTSLLAGAVILIGGVLMLQFLGVNILGLPEGYLGT